MPVYKKMLVPNYYLYAKNRGLDPIHKKKKKHITEGVQTDSGTVVGDRIAGGDRTPHRRWGQHSWGTHSKWRPHRSKRGSHGR